MGVCSKFTGRIQPKAGVWESGFSQSRPVGTWPESQSVPYGTLQNMELAAANVEIKRLRDELEGHGWFWYAW